MKEVDKESIANPVQRQASILYGFTWMAAFTPNVLSSEALHDSRNAIAWANSETRWINGERITHNDRQTLAAMDCLQKLVKVTLPGASGKFKRAVNGGEAVYTTIESHIDSVGIPPQIKYSKAIVDLTKLALVNYDDEVPADIAVARNVWQERGMVLEYSATPSDFHYALDAQIEAIESSRPKTSSPDFITADDMDNLTLGYGLPVPPETSKEVPFYYRYFSELSGATETLEAYMADTARLSLGL